MTGMRHASTPPSIYSSVVILPVASMSRRRRPSSGTLIMLSSLAHSVPAFLVGTTSTQHIPRAFPAIVRCGGYYAAASSRALPAGPLCLAKGFGSSETPKPVEKDEPKRRPAKSLMPLADAASKLLPKECPDGTVKFDNPAVGDFQVLDSLVEVSGGGQQSPVTSVLLLLFIQAILLTHCTGCILQCSSSHTHKVRVNQMQ